MTTRRWLPAPWAALWGLTALFVLGLGVWCLRLPGRTPPAFPEGDLAVIELYTWHAAGGFWEYGPYSRFGWHHPGPLYFYLLAPFYLAGGHHTLSLDAGALAINLVALALIVWGLGRWLRAGVALPLLAGVAWYVYEIARLLTSMWNPHVLLLPFAALLVTASTVMAGRLAWLPLLLAIGSFVAQTHVGLVPCAAAVCACALAGGWLRAARPLASRGSAAAPDSTSAGSGFAGRSPWWLAAAAALLVLLWLPPIVEQFTARGGGNVTAMLHFFGPSGPAEAGVPFGDAVAAWADALTTPIRLAIPVPYGNTIAIRPTLHLPALAAAEILLLALAAWRWHRQGLATEASLALLCAVASAIALLSIARIRGGLVDHLVSWITTLGVLNAGLLIGAAITSLADRPFSSLARLSPLVPSAAIVLLAWTGIAGVMRLEDLRLDHTRKAINNGRTPTQALYQELRGALAKAHIRKPLIHAAVLSWPQAAGIALQLTKKDVPFSSDLVWLFGPHVTPQGDEDADITVADTSTRHALTQQRAGDCMLIERHGTSLHLLALPPERFAALSCMPP